MKPARFEYFAPGSVDEVIAVLAEHGDDAKVLAGGQSLVPLMAFRLVSPGVLVDLNRIGDLRYARRDGAALTLGAMTTHREVETLDGLSHWCTMVADAVGQIGHVAIRNRGSVGGSIAHADPAAEWPAVTLALDAEIDVLGPEGERTIDAGDFFVSDFTTTLDPMEVITEIRLHCPEGDRVGSSFVELARRHGDFALAGAGTVLVVDEGDRITDARVTLIGVHEVAVRSAGAEDIVRGQVASDELLAAASEAVVDDISPRSDVHATAEDRAHFAKVLTRRALERANRRAVGDGGP